METNAIAGLRRYLSENGYHAMIIPSGDSHFGEYTQDRFMIIPRLCGFDGSAGTLVVTNDRAAMWTDSRYFEQAEKQMSGSGVQLMRLKMPGTPSLAEWIMEGAPENAVVVFDGSLFSQAETDSLYAEMSVFGSAVLQPVEDPFDSIIPERPGMEFHKVSSMPVSVSGMSASDKRRNLISGLQKALPQARGCRLCYFTQLCDEVAWLTNLRGSDIMYNPVFMSYAVASAERTDVFACRDSFSQDLLSELESESVYVHPYGEIADFLASLDRDGVYVVAQATRISVVFSRLFASFRKASFVADPVQCGSLSLMKGVKNEVEIKGFRIANEKDALAWLRFLKYIDDNCASGTLDEYSLACKLISIRKELWPDDYVSESFAPIVAFGANAALAHYEPDAEHSSVVGCGNFLLVDTGAQYLCGTTDVTRTIPVGEVTAEQRMDYALILKGMADLSMAVFRAGTTGHQLDILARGPLCSVHKIFMHGTGHGIGHYLNVHEGPQSIRMENNPVALQPGMVTSNEPAVYVPGKYGIRIENTILCCKSASNAFGDFYGFETLNLVPIETSFVREELRRICSPVELEWIDGYNRKVYETLLPVLSEQEAEWFRNKYLDFK